MAAWVPNPTAIPTSNSREGKAMPWRNDKAKTSVVVSSAPTTAPMGRSIGMVAVIVGEKRSMNIMPKPAPPVTPMVPGLARSLHVMPCRTTPATDRPAPTKMHIRSRGRRRSKTTKLSTQ